MTDMLDDNIKNQVRELFSGMKHPVKIVFFGSTRPERCQYCGETLQLLREVQGLSGLLSLSEYDLEEDSDLASQYKIDDVPGFVLVGNEGEQEIDYGIRFKGIPSGHEFSSLVNSLVLVSGRDSHLSEKTRQFLHDLISPVHLQVFVTPSCPHCPRAVVTAYQFALESPMVEAEMVEAVEFPELANRYDVSSVPQTTINLGAGTVIGAAPEHHLVEEIRAALIKVE
jgi:glutaredoxin-like protein